MELVHIKKITNGFLVEVAPYEEEEKTYFYATKDEVVAAFSAHVDEAVTLVEAQKAKESSN